MITPKKTVNNFLASLNIQFIFTFFPQFPPITSRVALLESVSSIAFACFFSLLLKVSFSWRLSGKESTCWWRRLRTDPWVSPPGVMKIPWRRKWQPTPVFLPGESPWTEEPGGLQSMGLQRVRHDWACMHTCISLLYDINRTVPSSLWHWFPTPPKELRPIW